MLEKSIATLVASSHKSLKQVSNETKISTDRLDDLIHSMYCKPTAVELDALARCFEVDTANIAGNCIRTLNTDAIDDKSPLCSPIESEVSANVCLIDDAVSTIEEDSDANDSTPEPPMSSQYNTGIAKLVSIYSTLSSSQMRRVTSKILQGAHDHLGMKWAELSDATELNPASVSRYQHGSVAMAPETLANVLSRLIDIGYSFRSASMIIHNTAYRSKTSVASRPVQDTQTIEPNSSNNRSVKMFSKLSDAHQHEILNELLVSLSEKSDKFNKIEQYFWEDLK